MNKKIILLILCSCFLITQKSLQASTSGSPNINNDTSLYENNLSNLNYERKILNSIEKLKVEAKVYKTRNNYNKATIHEIQISELYIRLGRYDDAIKVLLNRKNINNKLILAKVYEKLGNSYHGKKEYNIAIGKYLQSLRYHNSMSGLNNLVNSRIELLKKEKFDWNIEKNQISASDIISKREKKIAQYNALAIIDAKKALNLKSNNLSYIYALSNWYKLNGFLSDEQLIIGRRILNKNLKPSRQLIYGLLNWSSIDKNNSELWLNKSLRISQEISDFESLSYSYFFLAQLYRENNQLNKALDHAKKSAFIGENYFEYNALYQSYWLIGQIYNLQNKKSLSLKAYEKAIATLDLLNKDLYKSEYQNIVDFQIKVEPIYKEAIFMILNKNNPSEKDIKNALFISGKLKIFEIQNYFGDNCFEYINSKDMKIIDEKEARIYSIVLNKNTYLIVQFPNQSFKVHKIAATNNELKYLTELLILKVQKGTTWEFLSESQKIYNLIIAPIEEDLKSNDIKIISFVQDKFLRNLPLSILFDGEKYVAQKWATVNTLSLNPIKSYKEESFNRKGLFFGLSNAQIEDWTPLKKVKEEINYASNIINGDKYLDNEFTKEKLFKELENKNNYSVLHLATHSYFSGSPYDSFILAYDGKINLIRFGEVISNQSLDLLILSACETAKGNDRSALGLAGVAARNGVDATLASFWIVGDVEQNELIQSFYRHWIKDKTSKAIALQKTQQEAINRFSHPRNWGALNLIEN